MNPDVKPVSNDDVPGLLLRAARLRRVQESSVWIFLASFALPVLYLGCFWLVQALIHRTTDAGQMAPPDAPFIVPISGILFVSGIVVFFLVPILRLRTAKRLALCSDTRAIAPVVDSTDFASPSTNRKLITAMSAILARLDETNGDLLPERQRDRLRVRLRLYARKRNVNPLDEQYAATIISTLAAVGDVKAIESIRMVMNSGRDRDINAAAGQALARLEILRDSADVLLRAAREPTSTGQLVRPASGAVDDQEELLRAEVRSDE